MLCTGCWQQNCQKQNWIFTLKLNLSRLEQIYSCYDSIHFFRISAFFCNFYSRFFPLHALAVSTIQKWKPFALLRCFIIRKNLSSEKCCQENWSIPGPSLLSQVLRQVRHNSELSPSGAAYLTSLERWKKRKLYTSCNYSIYIVFICRTAWG